MYASAGLLLLLAFRRCCWHVMAQSLCHTASSRACDALSYNDDAEFLYHLCRGLSVYRHQRLSANLLRSMSTWLTRQSRMR